MGGIRAHEPHLSLTDDETRQLDAHWRAINYLSACQLYLRDNPLLSEPLRPEHIKPRLLGHWGTCPGLGLVYTHLNRVIRLRDGLVVPGDVDLAGHGHEHSRPDRLSPLPDTTGLSEPGLHGRRTR